MTFRQLTTLTTVCTAIFLFAGCDKAAQKPESTAAATTTDNQAAKAPKANLAKPALTPTPEKPQYYAGAHILVAYKGARRASPNITRTKEQAKKLAQELAEKARADKSKFAELAKKHSDGPSASQGGDLGTWRKGRMVAEFDQAIGKLEVGGISDPVETAFGFHVMVRKEVLPEVELSAAHILIQFKGAGFVPPSVTRSEADAKKLAEKLAAQLKKNPDAFAELAKKNSDDKRSATRAGSLGTWSSLASRMPPFFTNAVRELKVGEISAPVKTPFGYHIFRRTAAPPQYAGAHVLVAYKGAMRAHPKITRSKTEAAALASRLSKELQAAPDKFSDYAAKHSDGPSAKRGGSLGKWRKGRMVPEFDQAIEKLKIGEISGPVESPFGYHVIQRQDPAKQP